MTDEVLYSIRDIARQLELPESTVRFYRRNFAELVPGVGEGRRRRYPPPAVDIIKHIADGYRSNKTKAQIRAELESRDGKIPDAGDAQGGAAVTVHQSAGGTRLAGEIPPVYAGGDAVWHMAREIVRIGDAIEKQQEVLNNILGFLNDRVQQLTSPAEEDALIVSESDPADRAAMDAMEGELDRLREELTRERELVDRLRRSKLELERRVATAENRAGEPPPRQRSVVQRILGRE